MKLIKQLFSGWFMGVLLIVFATVIGYATFVENDYGPEGARLIIYNTRWFELLLFLMVVNFSGMIFTKKLYLKGKINILIIHLALIIIIIGAGATRYFGNEGQMHIREGQTSNVYSSSDKYLQVHFKDGNEEFSDKQKVVLSSIKDGLFTKNYQLPSNKITVSVTKFIPSSELALVPTDDGDAFISIVLGGPDGRHEFYLKEGDTKMLHDFGIVFGDTSRKDIVTVIRKLSDLFIRFPENTMANVTGSEEQGKEISGFNPIGKMTLHNVGNVSFVVKELIPSAKLEYVASENGASGTPLVEVMVNDKVLMLPAGREQFANINGTEVAVKIGTIALELPFSLKLNKFDLEHYPGSESPSSYASDVTLIDEANNVEMPYRIFMNHILNYKGYRFFQSSYDQDEKGTILSVNQDYWGTSITYFGYFVLFASLIATFFTGNTRFKRISYQLKEVRKKRKNLVVSVALLCGMLTSASAIAQTDVTSAAHAANFGKLFVQNNSGRIEPINTMASKILVKISKKSSYNGLTADQVFLGIMTNQVVWQEEPIIKVEDEAIQRMIGVNQNYAAFSDFISKEGNYKILDEVKKAHNKKPSARSTYDKALINVDERVNVFYMVLNGSVLRIFPIENHSNNKWVTPQEFHETLGHGEENADLYENYLISLKEDIESNNYQHADKHLEIIAAYQREISGSIMPSETSAKLEILYNKYNIFKTLFPFYLMIGIVLVGLFFLQTFIPKYEFKTFTKILFWILMLAFVFQTFGLGTRWYISGHAPWSNGYESMIYISWATLLAGFIFMKKSPITLGVTATVAGITLLTAHMSWLNPEVTNLVPVLKSYWLTIHVATITASYGFLALGCMVGFLNLCIMIFRNEKNYERVKLTLKELTLVIEMALSVGLILLIIGNFLGGIWANESWGRYWGWDPKETWTLVTIILYSFTLHLTLIPAIRNTFSFNFFATISFGAVLMTYFGVNYYLSGLHSYASGDAVPIPSFVFYSLGIFVLVSLLAAYNEFTFVKAKEKEEEK